MNELIFAIPRRPVLLRAGWWVLCTVGWLLPARAAQQDTAPKATVPEWVKKGAYVYRISTPDATNVLPQIEAGTTIVARLLDNSICQIPILNGIIGHDHPGACNWDGVWPDWNRVTFRANHDWNALSAFMIRARDNANVRCSFHLNVTDVDVGLRDYPETREFFKKLVAAKAIYRRRLNQQTGRLDLDPPEVPQDFPEDRDPINIFALVNYQRFWESGLARQMIDDFYGHLPYAPPILYLDVLNLTGGNFSTGLPNGPLGGSEETQRAGVIAILDYLHSKGTDIATEGPRPEFGARAGYVWLHGPGFSNDDYSVIAGGNFQLAAQQVLGNPGAFNVSPIAVTDKTIEKTRQHYRALLAGKPPMIATAGLETWHIADRSSMHDEFDIPGTGDPFRGGWADLVNNFYLTTIQELYHIGKGNTRSAVVKSGWVHLGKYVLKSGEGPEITVSVPDFVTTWQGEGARKNGQIMLETPLNTKVKVPKAGRYSIRVGYKAHSRDKSSLNVYVNDQLAMSFESLENSPEDRFAEAVADGMMLKAGENSIAFDFGPIRATWSDGTVAEWKTPYLRKGFSVTNGDLVFADDFNRMWPDTWSGQQKIYFFSWDGTQRTWKLPKPWQAMSNVVLYPLTPEGRGEGTPLPIRDGRVSPRLLPQVPYVLTVAL